MKVLTYSLGHNILQLCNVLVQIRLTTSKTKRDIQYCKLGVKVVSLVAEPYHYSHIFPNFGHSAKIFGTHSQEGLIEIYT